MNEKVCKHDGCLNVVQKPERNNQCYSCVNLLKVFKITTPVRDSMLISQLNKCAICDSTISFKGVGGCVKDHAVIDHCHNSGNLRSILCSSCNLGLGNFGDDLELLEKAVDYLKRYK